MLSVDRESVEFVVWGIYWVGGFDDDVRTLFE